MDSAIAPGLLIAVPQLLDPNFRHAVVLLLQSDDHGAMGVVINRESPLSLSELCSDHDIPYAGDPEKKVRMGGPVQPEHGLVLYGSEYDDVEGRSVFEGIRVSASTDTLSALCNSPKERFHCYSGYSGWGPGQLEREIREGSWILAPASRALVLETPPDEVWSDALASLGIDPALLVPGGGQEA